MYLPLLDVGESFSVFAWIRDAMQALVLYLFASFTSVCGGPFIQNTTQIARVQGASDGQYLIGVGIGDITGYVLSCTCFVPNLCPTAQ